MGVGPSGGQCVVVCLPERWKLESMPACLARVWLVWSHVRTCSPVHRRVPTAAVAELPAFAAGSAPHAVQQLQQEQEQLRLCGLAQSRGPPGRPQLLVFVPAKPPPSREAAEAWLAARRRRRRGKGRPGSGGSTDYAMNPNTGQLIPIGPHPQRSAGSAEAGGGVPSALLGDAELLGTPQLSRLSSQGRSGSLDGTAGTPTGPAQTPAAAAAAAAAAGDGGSSGSGSSGSEEEGGEDAGAGGSGAAMRGAAAPAGGEGEVQPSSPKYDERTFFFSNPFPTLQLTQQRPASATQRQRQRRRRRQAAAAAAASGGGPAAEHTLAGHGLPPFQLPPPTDGTAPQAPQQQRPSSRLREAGRASADQEAAQLLGNSQPLDSSQGSPASAPQQQQQQQLHARPGAGPGSTLLKSVLKSALKSAAGSRLGLSGSHDPEAPLQHPQRQQSQGSDGSGSGAKRVSFVAPSVGEGSQDGTPGGPPGLLNTPPLGAQQRPDAAQPPDASTAAAAAAAAQPPGGTAATLDATLPTERTQRRPRAFISQITPPSPGLGSGSAAAATPLSQAGFKMRRCVSGKGQQLTLLSLEVHADSRCAGQRDCTVFGVGAVCLVAQGMQARACPPARHAVAALLAFVTGRHASAGCAYAAATSSVCRGSLLPDPRHDAVRAVVLAVADDDEEVPDGERAACPACRLAVLTTAWLSAREPGSCLCGTIFSAATASTPPALQPTTRRGCCCSTTPWHRSRRSSRRAQRGQQGRHPSHFGHPSPARLPHGRGRRMACRTQRRARQRRQQQHLLQPQQRAPLL